MIYPTIRLLPTEARIFSAAIAPWLRPLGLPVDPGAMAAGFANRKLGVPPKHAAILLQGLMAVSLYQMLTMGPERPRIRKLIRDGILVYDSFDPHEEWWTYLDMLAQRGIGRRAGVVLSRDGRIRADCEDLGTAWAAESVADGWDILAVPVAFTSGDSVSHVTVYSPKYGHIDPSRLAGMRGGNVVRL